MVIQRLVFLIGIFVVGSSQSCERSATSTALSAKASPTNKYGFVETEQGRQILESAIALANGVIESTVPYQLRLHKSDVAPESPAPATGSGTTNSKSRNNVFVYLVHPLRRGQFGVCASSLEDQCVFVDAGLIEDLNRRLANGFDRGIENAPADLLAILLLHELGHVDSTAAVQVLPDDLLKLLPADIVADKAKVAELKADAFAARQIRSALTAHFGDPRMPNGMKLATVLPTLSFNMLGWRVLDQFGARAAGNVTPFADPESTHPNLGLRLLIINYVVSPTEKGGELIVDHVAGRTAPSRGT